MNKNESMCSQWQHDSESDGNKVKNIDKIRKIQVNQLVEFRNHPFKVEMNTELFELMKSIEKDGVLVPLIARHNPYGEGFEIISGHRRKAACEWAGVMEVPVIVRDLDDCQAVITMVDSNFQREHIKPSEKAFAYKMKLEAMRHQGRRTDICEEIIASDQVGPKLIKKNDITLRSNEAFAKEVNESVNQIKRYIRLTFLIPKILDLVDDGKMAFTVAVELSFLKEEEQYEIYAAMDLEQCTPSLSQANRLKRLSQKGTLDMDKIYGVLGEEKPNQRKKLSIRSEQIDRYFPKNFNELQKVEVIERLLKEWYENQIKHRKGSR